MAEAIIVALIGATATIITTIVTNKTTRDSITNNLKTQQAVTDTKIEHLTEEVRKHNGFAQRIPVLEEQIKVANHRIEDLESMERRHEGNL